MQWHVKISINRINRSLNSDECNLSGFAIVFASDGQTYVWRKFTANSGTWRWPREGVSFHCSFIHLKKKI